MKTIGIKLADGTFYPILEEGTPKKRMLDLTTAKDNQTKVQIDLYRSENGTMEDAEYVDTLEVTKLNPHPNGEPELHLSVGLDEENNLTAEVVDPETGKKSETEVNLVSRTEAERANPADFAITDAAADQIVDEASDETTYSSDELPDLGTTALEDMPFSFDSSSPSEAVTEAEEPSVADDGIDGSVPDFSGLDDIPVEDTTLEGVDFSDKDLNDEVSDDVGTESPALSEETPSDETVASDDFSSDNFSTEDFSLPEIDTSSDPNSLDGLDTMDDPFAKDSDTSDSDTSDASLEEFKVPDFDELTSSSSDSSAETTGLDFDDLNDVNFDSTEFDSTLDSLNSEPEDKIFDDFDSSTGSAASAGGAMDFSDLYDKETLAGEHASLYDEEEEEKKTHTPMIICIICAIICIIAVILLLFIVPSKYNLLASRNTNGVSILDKFFHKETTVEKTIEEPKEETKYVDVVVEEPKDLPAPVAEEDKIVIAPEPEKVVPEPTPAPVEEAKPEVKKSKDVEYHIRWGDTLWDLSESYYKTPWKYPKIADYNHIKNPDLIISGTDILIPAE